MPSRAAIVQSVASEFMLAASEHPRYDEARAIARRGRWRASAIVSHADVDAVVNHGCWYDAAAPDQVLKFYARLQHLKGRHAGKPFTLLPWQEHGVMRPLFGWRDAQGLRRHRRAYVEIPKKNGKSTLAAPLGLYLLTADDEAGPEVYTVAVDRGQARIVHEQSEHMIRGSFLDEFLTCVPSQKTIIYPAAMGKYEALSADAESAEGLNWNGLLFDELHAQRNRKLWDTLVYGGAARAQPLMFIITTAGIYDTISIGWQQHDYAIKVLEGTIQDYRQFAYIRCALEGEDWRKPEVWRRANPSIGVTITEEEIARECKEAVNSPAEQATFLRRRLNLWTRTTTRWISMSAWNKCADPVDLGELAGRRCYGGMDLSSTVDLTVLALAFPAEGGTLRTLEWYWLPEANILDCEHRTGVPYSTWASDGHISLTAGNVVDYDVVCAKITEIARSYDLVEVAYDPWNATAVATRLQDAGIHLVEHRQSFTAMNDPVKQLERYITSGQLRHQDHPITRWHVSNCEVAHNMDGNVKLVKADRRGQRNHIDGAVALAMAVGRAVAKSEDRPISADEIFVVC